MSRNQRSLILRPLSRVAFLCSITCLAIISVLDSPRAEMSDEAEIAAGANEFRAYCSSCHGVEGRGNGPVAKELKTPPADLTKLAWRAGRTFPREAIYEKIEGLNMPAAHGTSDMPVWGAQFVREELGDGVYLEDARRAASATIRRISRLVKYLEVIQD